MYDTCKSYQANLTDGPRLSLPEVSPRPPRLDFLGIPVSSPLGVAAGPLLNSTWVQCAARLGFDILTYKTIRAHAHPSHPVPNILYVDAPDLHPGQTLVTRSELPEDLDQLAITNSFGNPSQDPTYLLQDIAHCQNLLSAGQALVVSIFGDDAAGFDAAASLALEAGAPLLEANFSCPNITSGGALFQSPDAFTTIAAPIAKRAPLIVKMGFVEDPTLLRHILIAAARAGVRAISGINTIRARVVTPAGDPALSPERPYSGICGGPIRPYGLAFVRAAAAIIREEKLDLLLIGVGGITSAEHVDLYLEAGANFAQTATGMMWNPQLARSYHELARL